MMAYIMAVSSPNAMLAKMKNSKLVLKRRIKEYTPNIISTLNKISSEYSVSKLKLSPC